MRLPSFVLSICLLLGIMTARDAHAGTRVRVLETWPRGEHVVLARNQNFYLRIAYDADTPVSIWAQPYFQGKPAHAGSNPALPQVGHGEALGWFFLMQPGDAVDEVRIAAGDGSPEHTPVIAVVHVDLSGGSAAPDAHAEPEWVATMRAQAVEAQRSASKAAMNAPIRPADIAFFGGFMMLVYALGAFAFVAPAWALWRWRGGWRIAAAVPALAMACVVLRIVIDTGHDPTSHNLWPFEILMWGVPCAMAMIALTIAHRVARRGTGTGRGMR